MSNRRKPEPARIAIEQAMRLAECVRCGRRKADERADRRRYWIVAWDQGHLEVMMTPRGYGAACVCPGCQTAEEWTEAAVKWAILDYSRSREIDGRMYTPPKREES